MTHMFLVELTDGKHSGKQGQRTNAGVSLLIYRLVGLAFQYVDPTLASVLASREVPILDICQEQEGRNAQTRGVNLPRIHTRNFLEKYELRNLAWISVAGKGP